MVTPVVRTVAPRLGLIALLFCASVPPGASAASYSFADAARWINRGQVEPELQEEVNPYDTSDTGNPARVYLLDGDGGPSPYQVQSTAAVIGGTADDGTAVAPMTLKSYAGIGSVLSIPDQIEVRGQARFDAAFEILQGGAQSISISWNGRLHATGDAVASYSLQVGFHPLRAEYNLLTANASIDADNPGNLNTTDSVFNESRTLPITIDSAAVGSTYYLQAFLTTYAALPLGGGSTDGAYADFHDSFVVTAWSDGLKSLDGVNPIPLPGAVWLFASALLALGLPLRHRRS